LETNLNDELLIVIPDKESAFSLFADGIYTAKRFQKDSGNSIFSFPNMAAVFLFYTYPKLRVASLIRNTPGAAALPGLSKKVSLLFSVYSSRVDKLKRAIGYLNKNACGAYHFSDDFYLRLFYVLQKRGKLNYPALTEIAQKSINKGNV
jgi:hypothetical protein